VTILKMALLTLFLLRSSAAFAQANSQQPQPIHHEFVIRNFRTGAGTVLAYARIVYGTYGHLNAAGDNAVLLPSHYMADMNGYEWLIGPGKALDPDQLFLITSELFGNGR
jgi:homoserine O-acetyltransferase